MVIFQSLQIKKHGGTVRLMAVQDGREGFVLFLFLLPTSSVCPLKKNINKPVHAPCLVA